jgi:hypothetical protein
MKISGARDSRAKKIRASEHHRTPVCRAGVATVGVDRPFFQWPNFQKKTEESNYIQKRDRQIERHVRIKSISVFNQT